jgi:hypothetical protein
MNKTKKGIDIPQHADRLLVKGYKAKEQMTTTNNQLKEEFEKKFEDKFVYPGFDGDNTAHGRGWNVEGSYPDNVWSFIDQALNAQREEIKEKIEKIPGAVVKGTGKKWIVNDYVKRADVLDLLSTEPKRTVVLTVGGLPKGATWSYDGKKPNKYGYIKITEPKGK